MIQGPRDIFHGLSCLLASLSGDQSKSISLLQAKMTAADVPQILRFVELQDNLVQSPAPAEQTAVSLPVKVVYEEDLASTWPSPLIPFVRLERQDSYQCTFSTRARVQTSAPCLYNGESPGRMEYEPSYTTNFHDAPPIRM